MQYFLRKLNTLEELQSIQEGLESYLDLLKFAIFKNSSFSAVSKKHDRLLRSMKRRREIREKTAAFGVKSLYSAALGDFKGEIIQKFTKELIDNRQREQIN